MTRRLILLRVCLVCGLLFVEGVLIEDEQDVAGRWIGLWMML